MKTLVITFKDPAAGDLIVVEYASRRGGCTHVKHRVIGAHQRAKGTDGGIVTELEDVPSETPRDIAKIMASKINAEWMPEAFEAKASANGTLVINCTGLVQDVTFHAAVAGSGGTSVDIVEL